MRREPFGPTGVAVPVIGQGTWHMGEDPRAADAEVASLALGLDLGMTHVDTAEMYGDGGAERVVARAIRGRRDEVFLVSKVLPSNASYEGTLRACAGSLERLGTDRLDGYLLHWWSGRHPIEETMRAMAELVRRGWTRWVGVSNLDVGQMEDARAALDGLPLVCNQLRYHLRDRGLERAELPWCARRRVAVVGYTPLGAGGYLRAGPVVEIARRRGVTPRQVALAFLTRKPSLFAIPKASQPAHVRENAGAGDLTLTAAEIGAIDRAFR